MLSRLVLRVQQLFGSRCGEVSLDQAAAMVQEQGVFFFDVNAPQRFAQGHVPGAKNLRRGRLEESDLPPDKNARLVFYCGGPT